MPRRRFPTRGLLALAAAVMLAACSGGTPTGSAIPAAEAPGSGSPAASPTTAGPHVLVYASPTSFPDLDPSSGFSDDSAVVPDVYETLTRYGLPGSTPQIQPVLATSWDHSADGLTWTFHLRPGVKFHDGTPVNAAAVKFSIERTMKLAQGAAFIWASVKSIAAVDDLTVQFTLSYAAPMDLISSSGYGAYVMSPTIATGKDNAWFNAGHDAGSGPYMIDSYAKGQRAILKRFNDYWGGWKPGQFDTMILNVVQDAAARQQMIQSGQADYTWNIPTENLPALKADPSVKVVANPSFQNLNILLNTAKAPTKDVLVRQALSMAFPYQTSIDATMAGYATQSHGAVPASLLDGADQIPQYSYDIAKAKSLLAQAGYPSGGLSLTLTYSAGDTVEQQTAALFQAELAKIGIDLTVKAMTWEAQWSFAKGDPTKAQDLFMFYWWPSYPTPYDFLVSMYHSEKTPNFNLGYYRNPAYDKMIDDANTLLASDRTKAMAEFVAADTILVNDAAAIFVRDQENVHVIRADLNGFVDNPAYPHVLFAYNVSR